MRGFGPFTRFLGKAHGPSPKFFYDIPANEAKAMRTNHTRRRARTAFKVSCFSTAYPPLSSVRTCSTIVKSAKTPKKSTAQTIAASRKPLILTPAGRTPRFSFMNRIE